MTILERLFGSPPEGAARELEQPQPLPADQWWESAATHEVYQDGDWRPAVVEECGGRAFVVPAMRCYNEDDGEC